GPYLLVLRSFSNRMATTKRVTRVILMPDGQEVTVPAPRRTLPCARATRSLRHGPARKLPVRSPDRHKDWFDHGQQSNDKAFSSRSWLLPGTCYRPAHRRHGMRSTST